MRDNLSDFSIDEWCQIKGISRGTFYNLEKDKKAPRTIRIGSRRIITRAANEEWEQERTAAEPEESARLRERRKRAGPQGETKRLIEPWLQRTSRCPMRAVATDWEMRHDMITHELSAVFLSLSKTFKEIEQLASEMDEAFHADDMSRCEMLNCWLAGRLDTAHELFERACVGIVALGFEDSISISEPGAVLKAVREAHGFSVVEFLHLRLTSTNLAHSWPGDHQDAGSRPWLRGASLANT
jgi:predicted DNA-binding transcriptional regulator AlpA